MTINCPKCEGDITESYQGAEPDVGIMSGGYFCDACDLPVDADDAGGFDDDVGIGPTARDPAEPIGTPLSELSGRPGQPGYEKFSKIAKSWGFD